MEKMTARKNNAGYDPVQLAATTEKVVVAGKTARHAQVADRQAQVEALPFDAEQVVGIRRIKGPLMEVEAVEPQVVTGLDEVFDADFGAFEAEVVAADFDQGDLSL